ncbi:TPA: nitroreductase family protein [Clostridioides difficile]|nr:nitroreductase family protein [Clostridioides difficile]HBE9292562.1 nitroreductase family protein [Clostridioides difficile]HBF0432650.1 nitroreductase family protein [Clostridioides difficile]
MLEVIKNRRSIRTYIDKNIEEDKITEILKSAMQAPSSKNAQPWEFIIVDDKELLKELSKSQHRANHIEFAPLCIVVLGNRDKFLKPGKWIQDLGACTQNLLLEVTNQGLAACWAGVFPKNKVVNKVRQILDLPVKLVPYALISIGYSEEKNEFIDRFDENKIHRNVYKNR